MSGGGRIDPATGRAMRDKVTFGTGKKQAPKRQVGTGRIVPKGRLAHQRARRTGT